MEVSPRTFHSADAGVGTDRLDFRGKGSVGIQQFTTCCTGLRVFLHMPVHDQKGIFLDEGIRIQKAEYIHRVRI